MTSSRQLQLATSVLPVHQIEPPVIGPGDDPLEWFEANATDLPAEQVANLLTAVDRLRNSSIPVAFPTETVYGLGADATRSDAVRGIYDAKQRPSDNPLIVHVGSLKQLQKLMNDCLPKIYQPLISKFWPGPLTILLPLPKSSPFAPEVNCGKATVGIRMPSSTFARLLIAMTDRPIAAPSANASTRPSPTSAKHVLYDLNGRIELILDGGPCPVGVESTVVDGLSDPPAILRPGGVDIGDIKALGGDWANVEIGYKDCAEHPTSLTNGEGPRAPGMKYKHYSPRARVMLFEVGCGQGTATAEMLQSPYTEIGVITTGTWDSFLGLSMHEKDGHTSCSGTGDQGLACREAEFSVASKKYSIYNIRLGTAAQPVASSIFAALRQFDSLGCELILIEGIDDQGELAAAVMNRLRKAAGTIVKMDEEQSI